MKATAQQQPIIIVALLILLFLPMFPNVCFSEAAERERKVTKELTKEYQNQGFDDLTFEAHPRPTLSLFAIQEYCRKRNSLTGNS